MGQYRQMIKSKNKKSLTFFLFPIFGISNLELNLSDVGLFNLTTWKENPQREKQDLPLSDIPPPAGQHCPPLPLLQCAHVLLPKQVRFLRQEWKRTREAQVGVWGGTYSCVTSRCSYENDLRNALSLSQALPLVSSLGRENRRGGGGVKGGFVWSGWLQIWADQFSPGLLETCASSFFVSFFFFCFSLLSGSHKCDLDLLCLVTLLLLSSGVLFGWRRSSSNLQRTSVNLKKKKNSFIVKMIFPYAVKSYTSLISVHGWNERILRLRFIKKFIKKGLRSKYDSSTFKYCFNILKWVCF